MNFNWLNITQDASGDTKKNMTEQMSEIQQINVPRARRNKKEDNYANE